MTTQTTENETTFSMCCKAFRSYPIRPYRIRVEDDGTVWVWDDIVAHQWTSLHSLCDAAQRRARRIAAEWKRARG